MTTLYPTLVFGDQGLYVRAAGRALWRALGDEARNLRNGQYGVGMVHDCRRFQALHDIAPAWGRCGPKTWPVLDDYFDATCRVYVRLAREQLHAATVRQEIVHRALLTCDRDYEYTYTQSRPISWVCEASKPVPTDCSGWSIGLHKCVNAADPSGNGYNGRGWTGDLVQRGTRVSPAQCRAGDLVHYGDPWGRTGHVAMAIDDVHGRVASFGSEPGPRVLPFFYRGDFDQCRRHLPFDSDGSTADGRLITPVFADRA